MTVEKVIPVLRIFDYKNAIEFYVDWLGLTINWEHYFEEILLFRWKLKKMESCSI